MSEHFEIRLELDGRLLLTGTGPVRDIWSEDQTIQLYLPGEPVRTYRPLRYHEDRPRDRADVLLMVDGEPTALLEMEEIHPSSPPGATDRRSQKEYRER